MSQGADAFQIVLVHRPLGEPQIALAQITSEIHGAVAVDPAFTISISSRMARISSGVSEE